jgi:hypothetical protein
MPIELESLNIYKFITQELVLVVDEPGWMITPT